MGTHVILVKVIITIILTMFVNSNAWITVMFAQLVKIVVNVLLNISLMIKV
jgi:hypothetical protein